MRKRPIPIYSTLEDEPGMREEIDHFVVRLAEQVDAIQDALCTGDLELVRTRSTAMAEAAERLGYSQLADASRSTAEACADGKRGLAEDGVVEITELGQGIRLGHRGAA